MSLLVGLRGTDGLVLATDSRGTFGDPRGVTARNDQIKKLYLANERVGILVAGTGDLGSTVVSGFLALPDIASLGVTELTMALHRHSRKQFAEWFELFAIKPTGNDSRPPRPDLNFIVAGFGLNHDPKIYRMSSSLDFAPMLHNYGFGVDGVAQYALYLLKRLYDPASEMDDLRFLAALHNFKKRRVRMEKSGGDPDGNYHNTRVSNPHRKCSCGNRAQQPGA